jgi:hypothetical protein
MVSNELDQRYCICAKLKIGLAFLKGGSRKIVHKGILTVTLVCTGPQSTGVFRIYCRKLTASVLADWQSIISSSFSADLRPLFCC